MCDAALASALMERHIRLGNRPGRDSRDTCQNVDEEGVAGRESRQLDPGWLCRGIFRVVGNPERNLKVLEGWAECYEK